MFERWNRLLSCVRKQIKRSTMQSTSSEESRSLLPKFTITLCGLQSLTAEYKSWVWWTLLTYPPLMPKKSSAPNPFIFIGSTFDVLRNCWKRRTWESPIKSDMANWYINSTCKYKRTHTDHSSIGLHSHGVSATPRWRYSNYKKYGNGIDQITWSKKSWSDNEPIPLKNSRGNTIIP